MRKLRPNKSGYTISSGNGLRGANQSVKAPALASGKFLHCGRFLVAGCCLLGTPFSLKVRADSTWVYAVQISASVQTSPAAITLSWKPDEYGAASYTIFRKSRDATVWGAGTVLSGSASNYVDMSVAAGGAYEYQIVKAASLGYAGYGYIYAGINAPLVEDRGKIILVVDNTYAANLSAELLALQMDLAGDGWTVIRRDVSRSDTPDKVKAIIVNDYQSDPARVRAVFLFGRVPVLRSGSLNVDGHQARPMPADAYYGDMQGLWNNPSYLPSDVELMVGRVDLFNLPGNLAPAPWPSELELLRNYLKKDHNWRHQKLHIPRRALLGNRIGDASGLAYAASGFRSFEPLAGLGQIFLANELDSAPPEQRWISMLTAGPYLLSYACGGGDYTSMSAMGTHGQYFVGQDARAVFFMMYGSWFGDWDSTDNLMRSVLATPTMGLTCCYSGRPHWFLHHMGLGEPIGYSARLAMNNSTLYKTQTNAFTRGVHIALLGDPTLRLHPVAPPDALTAVPGAQGTVLNWAASPDSVVGYHVYRAASALGPFTRLTSALVTTSSFTDTTLSADPKTYMVRAVKLESTPSGTYYNPSQGIFLAVGGGTGGQITIQTSRGPGGLTLRWNSRVGQTYRVQGNAGLTKTNWTEMSGNIQGTGSITSWTDAGLPAIHQRFYRVLAP